MNPPALAGLMVATLVALMLDNRQRTKWRPRTTHLQVSLPFVLEMMAVCVRLGSSIPRSLELVGESLGGDFGEGLQRISTQLHEGNSWNEAWISAIDSGGRYRPDMQQLRTRQSHAKQYRQYYALLERALEPSWRHGMSPVLRIEAVIEQLNRDCQRDIEEAGAKLAVRVLLPVGLCFLPSFLMIGVIPCLAAFAHDAF